MTGPHHFMVSGPRRDYDYSTFCEECNEDAVECAQEWLAEVFDGLDIGEDVSVTMQVVAGKEPECHGDSCKRAEEPAPHVVLTAEPVELACMHCGERLPVLMPLPTDSLVKLERRFRSRHCDCPKPAGGGA